MRFVAALCFHTAISKLRRRSLLRTSPPGPDACICHGTGPTHRLVPRLSFTIRLSLYTPRPPLEGVPFGVDGYMPSCPHSFRLPRKLYIDSVHVSFWFRQIDPNVIDALWLAKVLKAGFRKYRIVSPRCNTLTCGIHPPTFPVTACPLFRPPPGCAVIQSDPIPLHLLCKPTCRLA